MTCKQPGKVIYMPSQAWESHPEHGWVRPQHKQTKGSQDKWIFKKYITLCFKNEYCCPWSYQPCQITPELISMTIMSKSVGFLVSVNSPGWDKSNRLSAIDDDVQCTPENLSPCETRMHARTQASTHKRTHAHTHPLIYLRESISVLFCWEIKLDMLFQTVY